MEILYTKSSLVGYKTALQNVKRSCNYNYENVHCTSVYADVSALSS